MRPRPTRLSFRIGDVFSADDPVAVFLVALSSALTDSVRTSKWLLGADHRGPGRRYVAPDEHLHLLRLQLAQLHEVRETVSHGRKDPLVEAFLASLGVDAARDLDTVLGYGAPGVAWIKASIEHLRHQTFHYGGKWNWDHTEWAVIEASDRDGELISGGSNLAGLTLGFADEVATQHLLRRVPERTKDPHAPLSDEEARERLGELFRAAATGGAAAQNLLVAAVVIYVDSVNPDAVTRSFITRRERARAAVSRRWETRPRHRRRR